MKGYFTFNRTEQRGIAVLSVLILIVILINILLPYFIEDEKPNYTEFKKEIAKFEASQLKAKQKYFQKEFKSDDITKRLHPFPFDPNGLPVEKWKKLGLSDKQIKVIKNYERKGGRFYKNEDLAKIYGISKEEYKILEPYITIVNDDNNKSVKVMEKTEISPFPFDPNVVDENSLLTMKLDTKLVSTIINYREKGGRFYKKEDLKRIYGMKPEIYRKLEPFIKIESDTTIDNTDNTDNKPEPIVELNSADTLDLQQLKGIGPSYAKRIVKYRKMLGGYYSKTQLMEVYGMDSVRYNNMKNFVTVNPDSVKRTDINSATIKQLIKHPYIDFYTAKSIVKYRQKIGKFSGVSQLKDSAVVPDELYRKIAPYLTVK